MQTSKKKSVNRLVYKISVSPKSQQTFWGEEEQRRECGMIFCIKNRHKRYIACDDDGGELGIRTLDPFRDTAFRVLHLRPLGQLSKRLLFYQIISKLSSAIYNKILKYSSLFFSVNKKTEKMKNQKIIDAKYQR